MPLFSRKPSKEAVLQRIYTEAYQSSLQSILKESSFEFRSALDMWKQTLTKITGGMGQMDGSPPRTGQEKSLLASIMDIERQCHDRIASLEARLNKARISAGLANGPLPQSSTNSTSSLPQTASSPPLSSPKEKASTNPTAKKFPQRVAVGSKAPAVATSVPSGSPATQTAPAPNVAPTPYSHQTNATTSNGPSQNSIRQVSDASPRIGSDSPSSSPLFDFTEQFTSSLPKVRDMPYNLYTKKPTVAPIKTDSFATTLTSSSVPPSASPSTLVPKSASDYKQASQHAANQHAAQQRASLEKQQRAELQQKAEAQAQAKLIQQQQQQEAYQHAQQQALHQQKLQQQAQQQAQQKAEQQQAEQQKAEQQKAAKAPPHRSSLDYPQPAPAQHGHSLLSTMRNKNPLKGRQAKQQQYNHSSGSRESLASQEEARKSAALTAAKQTTSQSSGAPRPVSGYQQFSGFDGAFVSDSQPTSPSVGSGETFSDAPSFQSPVQPTTSGPKQTSYQQQALPTKKTQFQVHYDKVPTASGRTVYRPRVVRTAVGPDGATSGGRGSMGASSGNGNARSSSNSQGQHRQSRLLADGSAERQSSEEEEEMDDWDRMVQEKIKGLRGVDKDAAQQIVNEVVLKGDKVQWDDIAGLEKAKASLKETVVYPFLRPDLFMGLREPVLGMLLFGPPGTGKTMLARAVATESNSTFFSISASSLTSKFMGESEKLVRALFQLAKALAPSIIFVDEIDSILTQRADSGEHEASRRIKNEFLVQWSDLQAAAAGKADADSNVRRVLVLGATNLPWAIDEAARRRFVRRQYIPLPEPYTRQVHLLKLLSNQKHALTENDLIELVKRTDGYSGSDLTALAKDAAMGPLRSLGDALLTTAPDQIRPMGMSDFIESMRSIRPSVSSEGLRAFEQWADMYGSSGA